METTTAKDTFTWHFTYHNGIQVPEFDQSRPDGRALADVDMSQVKQLDLDTSDMLGKHSVVIPDGANPVFLRRRRIVIDFFVHRMLASTDLLWFCRPFRERASR